MPHINHCLCPPEQELCPPSENCAPKKATGLVPVQFSSRPETPKILIITHEFVSKNRFFADSSVKTFCFFFCFFGFHSRIRGKKFLCPPKIVYAPQLRYSGAGLSREDVQPTDSFILKQSFRSFHIDFHLSMDQSLSVLTQLAFEIVIKG